MNLSSGWSVCGHSCSLSREVATLVPLVETEDPRGLSFWWPHQCGSVLQTEGGGVEGLFCHRLILLKTLSEGRPRP